MGSAIIATVAMFATAAVAAAAPGVQTWTGQDAGPTPDIALAGLDINRAGGGSYDNSTAGVLNFTLNGQPYVGVCIDLDTILDEDVDVPVDIDTSTPAAGSDHAALAWLLTNRLPAGDPSDPALQSQAAAVQIATWLLVDADSIDVANPTADPAVNAAAFALVAEARAATATAASLNLSAATPAAGSTSTTLTVTGRPGAVVDLSITAGAGSLSATQVTLDAAGSATVTLSSAGVGSVAVAATTVGDAELLRVIPVGEPKTQATATARPAVLNASASVEFTAVPTTPTAPTTPTTPVTPTVPVTPNVPSGGVAGAPRVDQFTRARLAITKTAPRRAVAGRQLVYTIRVRNTSRAIARRVVLTDPLPSGLVHVRTNRSVRVVRGTVQANLGNLRPGATATIRVTVRVSNTVTGRRVNRATAVAANASRVQASALTNFRRAVRQLSPAVAG